MAADAIVVSIAFRLLGRLIPREGGPVARRGGVVSIAFRLLGRLIPGPAAIIAGVFVLVSIAFRLLGRLIPGSRLPRRRRSASSQLPFGFWVD